MTDIATDSKGSPEEELVLGMSGTVPYSVDRAALTKHVMVFGATGAGKTVLCKSIVEELSLGGIPILALDPKGDIGNLAIKSESFEFRPYSDHEAEARKIPPELYADQLKELYSRQLAAFSVSSARVKRFVSEVPVRIYTPRNGAGIPISLSPRLDSPRGFGEMLRTDPTLANEILELTSTILLKLVGYTENDRVQISLVSEILNTYWSEKKPVTLELLVDSVVEPPFRRLGRIPVSEVLGRREKLEFNSRMNLLLTDPAKRSWFIGEEIDYDRWFKSQRPGINVIDLRGMTSEVEKQVFVEYLLEKLFLWLIRQEGVQALRYLLYFDEIYGFCPPVSAPASKRILLRLIKQARAYGLGLLLATQNPSDVDYKVISNANLRCIGRLSTKQDIEHVRTGLDLTPETFGRIASLTPGEFLVQQFDRQEMRVVRPRWLMSYHRGPLDLEEIRSISNRQEGRRAWDSSSREEGRREVVSIDNVIPISSTPEEFDSQLIRGASSRLIKKMLSLRGFYVAEFSIDFVKNFSHFNKSVRIKGRGTLVTSQDGRVVEFRAEGADEVGGDQGPASYALTHPGASKPVAPAVRFLALMKDKNPRRETIVRGLPHEFELEADPPLEAWRDFDRNGSADYVGKLYQKRVRLAGARTDRTEVVVPSIRSIWFSEPKRVYRAFWELTYDVELGPKRRQRVTQFIDASTRSLLAISGYPSCPGGPTRVEHEIVLGTGILQNCAHVTCPEHFRVCPICGQSGCTNCSNRAACNQEHYFCAAHTSKCVLCPDVACSVCFANKCAHPSCKDHTGTCSSCHEPYCLGCLQKRKFLSVARVCPTCRGA